MNDNKNNNGNKDKDRKLIDTNILIYSIDKTEKTKRNIAKKILTNLLDSEYVGSVTLLEALSSITGTMSLGYT